MGTTHDVIALPLFGIVFEQALAFAIVIHALSIGMNILLGLLGRKFLDLDFCGLNRLALPD